MGTWRSTSPPAPVLTTSRRSRSASLRSSPRPRSTSSNLNSYGAKSLKNRWLSWKWRQSIARNGAQIGFGTDVGSLAICYRADLFRRAGLPTTPAKVSALWPTWQKYIAAGMRYQKHSPKDTHFFDSASNVYNAMVGQLTPAYYSPPES